MYALSCDLCALPGAEVVLNAIQTALAGRGVAPVGTFGQWSSTLAAALTKYQKQEGFAYTGGKPEYWSVSQLLAATTGAPAFWEWADAYQQATGKRPNEGVFNTQLALRKLGFNPGPIDGLTGPQTLAAIKSWQKTKGASQTGTLTVAEVQSLIAEATDPAAAAAKDAQAVAAAEAAGVPVVEVPDAGVVEPKVVVIRDAAGNVVRVEKLVPKKLIPWMWIGLGTAAVLGVGGVIALIVRAKREPEASRMPPTATMGDASRSVYKHSKALEIAERELKKLQQTGRGGSKAALDWERERDFQYDQLNWHRAHPRRRAALGDPARTLREHQRAVKAAQRALVNMQKEGNVSGAESFEREIAFQERQIQWHRDHPKGY